MDREKETFHGSTDYLTFLVFIIYVISFTGSSSVIHGEATWFDANKECKERYNGGVIDITKENHDVINTNWLFWTGRYKILSPWIQLYGCVEVLNGYEHRIENMSIEKCLHFCLDKQFQFFGVKQNGPSCICFRKNFKDLYLRDTSAFNCRKPGYRVNTNMFYLYNVLSETEEPNQTGSQRCLLLNCGRNTESYEDANCSEQHKAICANGNRPSDVRTWSRSKEFCYSKGFSLALKADSRITSGCGYIKSKYLDTGKYWIGAFRMEYEMEYTGQYLEKPVAGCEVVGHYRSSRAFHTWESNCYQLKLRYVCKTGIYDGQWNTTNQENYTQNLNKGMVAVVTVACVVFVGIISFIMFYLLCKRKRNMRTAKTKDNVTSVKIQTSTTRATNNQDRTYTDLNERIVEVYCELEPISSDPVMYENSKSGTKSFSNPTHGEYEEVYMEGELNESYCNEQNTSKTYDDINVGKNDTVAQNDSFNSNNDAFQTNAYINTIII